MKAEIDRDLCTGDEICDSVAGCVSTGDPCPEGMTCNEDTDTCDPSGKNVKGLSWLMLLLGDENNLQVCGNGKLEANEECDDGNLENGDGCESNCKVTNRIVFITSNSYTGNMGGLDGADSICNQLASAAQLTGTYKAWLSDDTSSPAGRFTHYGQFVLVDGDPVANDWEDLTDGTIMNPINIDENGNNFPEEYFYVWSNTDSDGSVYETTSICLNWTTDSPDERGRGAYPALTDYRWTRPTYTNNCGNTIFRIYCFEQ